MMYIRIKAYQPVLFKYVQLIVCQLYLDKLLKSKHIYLWLLTSLFTSTPGIRRNNP